MQLKNKDLAKGNNRLVAGIKVFRQLLQNIEPIEEQRMHLLWWIIVGLIAGWATGKIMRGSGYGTLMDILIGIVGALVGGWIMRSLGFAGQGGTVYTILVAIGGAIVLTLVYRLIVGNRTSGTGGIRRAA
jgi:uncharacterized membrane protein YeaQ/YmgE (transglycosylase-associated protein family)